MVDLQFPGVKIGPQTDELLFLIQGRKNLLCAAPARADRDKWIVLVQNRIAACLANPAPTLSSKAQEDSNSSSSEEKDLGASRGSTLRNFSKIVRPKGDKVHKEHISVDVQQLAQLGLSTPTIPQEPRPVKSMDHGFGTRTLKDLEEAEHADLAPHGSHSSSSDDEQAVQPGDLGEIDLAAFIMDGCDLPEVSTNDVYVPNGEITFAPYEGSPHRAVPLSPKVQVQSQVPQEPDSHIDNVFEIPVPDFSCLGAIPGTVPDPTPILPEKPHHQQLLFLELLEKIDPLPVLNLSELLRLVELQQLTPRMIFKTTIEGLIWQQVQDAFPHPIHQ